MLSTNTAGGYHTIRVYGVLNVTNNYIAWSRGTARVWDNTVGIGTYYSKGSYTLVSKDINVYCDNNGHASVYVDGSLDTTFVSGSTGGTAYLPDIPRYPILNSGKDFKDNENPVFNITAYGAYNIRVRLEASGASRVSRDLSTKNSTVYTLELTTQERETLRNLMTGDSLTVRYVVCAVNNGSEIAWSWKDYKMTKGSRGARLKINGQFKEAIPYVRVNGQWKEAIPYIRVNNQWKEGI